MFLNMSRIDKRVLLYVFVVLLYVGSSSSISPCGTDRFWCSNNLCIKSYLVCNDRNDCWDWSDERSCQGCPEGSFSCKDYNVTCIDPAVVCDTLCDCDNCNDEKGCYSRSYVSQVILGFAVASVFIVILVYGLYHCIRGGLGKCCCRKRARVDDNTVLPPEERPDILGDLPPSYDSVINNPAFEYDTVYDNPSQALPSYEDLADSDVPPPPCYETVHLPDWTSAETPGVPLENYTVHYTRRTGGANQNGGQNVDGQSNAADGNQYENASQSESAAVEQSPERAEAVETGENEFMTLDVIDEEHTGVTEAPSSPRHSARQDSTTGSDNATGSDGVANTDLETGTISVSEGNADTDACHNVSNA